MTIAMRTTHAAVKPVRLIVTRPAAENANPQAQIAADLCQQQLQQKTDSVLGLATGDSVRGLYKELVSRHQQNKIDFSGVTTFNLDEYLGLGQLNYSQTYLYFMLNYLFKPIGLQPDQVNFLDSFTNDPAETCYLYEKAISEAGGIDLQLLGLGANGHVAFNEPGSPINSMTRVVDLSRRTRISNSRFFMQNIDRRIFWLRKGEYSLESSAHWTPGQSVYFEKNVLPRVPKQAMTMGIKTILRTRKLLMLVSGATKATALRLALLNEPNQEIPASFLRYHPDFTIIADMDAASLLPEPWNSLGEYELEAQET